jgi:hypothetical protein
MRSELVGPVIDDTFALYPQARTRAFRTYFGKNSGWLSQQMFCVDAVHVAVAPPLSPWTATMLCCHTCQPKLHCSSQWATKENHLLRLYVPVSWTVQFLKPENLLGRIHSPVSEQEICVVLFLVACLEVARFQL